MGIDLSYNLLRLAQNKFRIPVLQANITELPFRENSFDAVWAIASLLHLSKHEIEKALKEIRRVLRPEGVFISSMKEGAGESSDSRSRHFAYYTSEEWGSILSSSGFQILDCNTSVEKRMADEPHNNSFITWIVCLAKSGK